MPTDSNGSGRHAHAEGRAGHQAAVPDPTETAALAAAARAGDRQAAEALLQAHLPLLYSVVGRALDGHADVDDVVQETVLRAYRDLSTLRSPASFRSWLVAIGMHQVGTRLASWRQERERTTPLDEAGPVADPEAEFTDVTLLRLGLSTQRRQVAAAAHWLDPDDQELVGLWWREVTGDLTRAQVAEALGIDAAHTRVRIQRMRQQLELSRFLVAALEVVPGCPGLARVAEEWDGRPGPLWRKRFGRHLRDCPVCGAVRAEFFPIERLLVAAAAVPLPAAVGGATAAGLLAGTATTTGAGAALGSTAAGWLGSVVGAKVAATVLVGAAVTGGVYLALPDDPPREPGAVVPVPAPSRSSRPEVHTAPPAPRSTSPSPAEPPRSAASPTATALVPLGQAFLRPAGRPDSVVTLDGDRFVTATGVPPTVLTVVPGIADPKCVSLRAADGRYLRHASFQIILSENEDRQLFREDATFCPGRGPEAGTVRLTSVNYTDRFVRVLDGRLRLDPSQTDDAYVRATSFEVVAE